jgi:N-acetylglutamate synthase-like GNAT family acetyltransferase
MHDIAEILLKVALKKIHQSNHGEVYAMEHYVIKFFSELQQVSGFLGILRVSSHNKNDCHDIAEILLKVALSIVPLALNPKILGLFI